PPWRRTSRAGRCWCRRPRPWPGRPTSRAPRRRRFPGSWLFPRERGRRRAELEPQDGPQRRGDLQAHGDSRGVVGEGDAEGALTSRGGEALRVAHAHLHQDGAEGDAAEDHHLAPEDADAHRVAGGVVVAVEAEGAVFREREGAEEVDEGELVERE